MERFAGFFVVAAVWLVPLEAVAAELDAEDGGVAAAPPSESPAPATEVPAPPDAAAPRPAAAPADEESLEAMLARRTEAGEVGSFGYRLESLKTEVYVHGFATLDFIAPIGKPSYFDPHYFNVFVGANIFERVFPEVQLELEHGNEFAIRYAQVDARAAKWLVVRAGLFLVPFGQFNEVLYPEYLSRTPRGPMVTTHSRIIPVAWNDVGLQLRGTWDWGQNRGLSYALYVSNGLEQKSPTAGVVSDGGQLRSMRGNMLDANHGDKAIGGRLAVAPIEGLLAGGSFYTGAYTTDGRQRLTMVGGDVSLKRWGLHALFEAAWVGLTTSAGPLERWGLFGTLAYRVTPWLEPAVAIDRTLGGTTATNGTRSSVGLNVRPVTQYSENFVVRAFYTAIHTQAAAALEHLVILQTSVAF